MNVITHAAEMIAMGHPGRETDAVVAHADKIATNKDGRFVSKLTDAEKQLAKAHKNMNAIGDLMVSQTLILPMLEQLRDDPLRSELFHGGFAEDAFAQHMDMKMADRIAESGRLPIGKIIADQYMPMIELDPKKVEYLANLNINTVA